MHLRGMQVKIQTRWATIISLIYNGMKYTWSVIVDRKHLASKKERVNIWGLSGLSKVKVDRGGLPLAGRQAVLNTEEIV